MHEFEANNLTSTLKAICSTFYNTLHLEVDSMVMYTAIQKQISLIDKQNNRTLEQNLKMILENCDNPGSHFELNKAVNPDDYCHEEFYTPFIKNKHKMLFIIILFQWILMGSKGNMNIQILNFLFIGVNNILCFWLAEIKNRLCSRYILELNKASTSLQRSLDWIEYLNFVWLLFGISSYFEKIGGIENITPIFSFTIVAGVALTQTVAFMFRLVFHTRFKTYSIFRFY